MAKKIWKFLSSMRFAIILLLILAAACAGGSFIPQGQSFETYVSAYSERTAALILALRLDDVFHSWWFLLLGLFLCGNLLLCNLLRLKPLVARTLAMGQMPEGEEAGLQAETAQDPAPVFSAMGMRPKEESRNGVRVLYAVRNRAGIWGAWVCHLGILLLILGFGLGQMTHQEYTVYGVPGQRLPVGDTGLSLTIEDFQVALREDDTVEQYTAQVALENPQGQVQRGTLSVNHPATLFGLRCYQNSTGWAARVRITEDGASLQDQVLCAGEGLRFQDKPELVLFFHAFYPDYVLIPGSGPATQSGKLNNPAYLYSLHYGEQMLGMNVLQNGEAITVDGYEVRFSEPQNYTLIQLKKDRFSWLALLGALVTLAGLVLAFYLQPARLWAEQTSEGWRLFAQNPKGGALFRERFQSAVQNLKEE